ncbi:hypothetical protein CHU98_g7502 [Xylaria longipes]|nr:hypothetical protein CHU98_g7502 [Xylaria longipes]
MITPKPRSRFWHFCEHYLYRLPEPPRIHEKSMEVLCGWKRLVEKKYYGVLDSEITTADFDALLGHATATTEKVAYFFAPELIAAYPDAKVVLNRRSDLDKWSRSMKKTVVPMTRSYLFFLASWFDARTFWSYHFKFRWFLALFYRNPGDDLRTSFLKRGKWVYRDHCNMIRGQVLPKQLLEWTTDDRLNAVMRTAARNFLTVTAMIFGVGAVYLHGPETRGARLLLPVFSTDSGVQGIDMTDAESPNSSGRAMRRDMTEILAIGNDRRGQVLTSATPIISLLPYNLDSSPSLLETFKSRYSAINKSGLISQVDEVDNGQVIRALSESPPCPWVELGAGTTSRNTGPDLQQKRDSFGV